MIFVDIESTHFELETALKDFDPNRVHNIAPVRDMEYFREEWKHSQVSSITVALPISYLTILSTSLFSLHSNTGRW